MIQRLSSFSVGQTAKVLGVLYGLMGLIVVPFFLLAASFSPHRNGGFGIGFALVVPVIYGVFGFVFTAIGCALYNWVAGMVGGIEIKLDNGPGAA
jgi:cyanate permease